MDEITIDILSFAGLYDDDINHIEHYGTKRHSGRYPWGSGKQPYQHSGDFLSRVEELRKINFTCVDEKTGKTLTGDNAIAYDLGLTSTEFRTQYTLAKDERRILDYEKARSLRSDGKTLQEIADIMGYANESSIRSLLDPNSASRTYQSKATADFLKKVVDEKGMIDVGVGVEQELGVSKEKLREALYILELQGYEVYGGGVQQVTNPGKQTNIKVLCVPGTEHKEIFDFNKVGTVMDYISYDDGESFRKAFEYPSSLDSKRLQIVYGDEGGKEKDGLVELRRGVNDISLGDSNYAQVRIMVDGTHYIKGMAVYNDDLPDGIDIRFNTNKLKKSDDIHEVLKEIKPDPDNPFGSLIKEHGGQSYYDDPNGKYTDPVTGKKQSLSLINKRAEEGDWGEWSDKLPAQFLSKQSYKLAEQQLKLAEKDKEAEYDEICSYTNPTIKKALLKSFSDDCDGAAVHLKAAALPRQKYQVIMPLTDIRENEVYAPNYYNGETVALIRYPHGGTFEIPILKVNNKNAQGIKLLGAQAKDAIGIKASVAERLSGADFDGDTVMVIPLNDKAKVISTKPLEGLKDFDGKIEYGCDEKRIDKDGNVQYYRNGKKYKLMSKENTQKQMGIVSNLITDMTLKGASEDELARAVRHSMVVIDAEKHKLDYKQSFSDNRIDELIDIYQGRVEDGKYKAGASTLISKAKSEQRVLKRVGQPKIDPETGELKWKSVEEHYYNPKTGKDEIRTLKSTKMAETNDARTLISKEDTAMERLYANYANKMKSLANSARKEYLTTPNLKYDKNAHKIYENEVKSLEEKYRISASNAPKERKAQMIANTEVKAKQNEYDLTKAELKKVKQKALTEARNKVGAKRVPIDISDKEWNAIQAGAITDTQLTKILKYADMDKLKERAMPKTTNSLSEAKISKIQAMKGSGYTTSEIAQSIGVSTSTVSKYLKEKE